MSITDVYIFFDTFILTKLHTEKRKDTVKQGQAKRKMLENAIHLDSSCKPSQP
jgi:hypothetical protein